MCPAPQLLSIYLDGELPSPWKEKMENHLAECSACRQKIKNFEKLLDKPDVQQVSVEQEVITAAKDRIWQNLQSRRSFQPRVSHLRRTNASAFLQRRLSIPIPAAAAAALIIAFMSMMFVRGGQGLNDGLAIQHIEPHERANIIFAADEDIPGIIPVADINSVLQYLNSDRPDFIIIQLPESQNFYRAGDPEIIRAADYQRDVVRRNGVQRNESPRRSR
jgi:hypothetical protein